jgi:quercetin dioxygenase-like cupin family protein
MPAVDQTLANPVTGETITFVRTARETDDAAVELAFAVTPGGSPPAAHVHPVQTETFVVHEGRCRIVVDGVECEAGPGDVVAVPPGVPHTWSAVTDLQMHVTLEPALRSDEFFEDLFAISIAGHVDARGLPTPLYFAVLLDDYRDVVYLAGPPVPIQKALCAVLAKVGRVLGRTAPRTAPEPSREAAVGVTA